MVVLKLLLLSFLVSASENEEVKDQSDAQKTLNCVLVVREARSVMEGGSFTKVNISEQLESLNPVGQYLKAKARSYITEMESVEKKCNEDLHRMNGEVKKLQMGKNNAEYNKTDSENKYLAMMKHFKKTRRKLSKYKVKLEESNSKLMLAKEKLNKKEENTSLEKRRRRQRRRERRSIVLGMKKSKHNIFATGESVSSDSVSQAEEKVGDAKGQVDKANNHIRSLKNEFETTKTDIDNAEKEIQWHETRMKALQHEIDESQSSIGLTQGLLGMLKESARFWKLFTQATASPRPSVELFREMIEMISEEKSYNIICGDGSITHARSFIDVWLVFVSSAKVWTQPDKEIV